MFADLFQVVDDVGVAGVEPDADSCEVRTLRQRVNSDHTIDAIMPRNRWRPVALLTIAPQMPVALR